jgi:hypothetical protein
MNQWKKFLILNKQQIFSIDVFLLLRMDRLCAEFTVSSRFSRLEWVALKRVHSNQIMSLIIELSCLPYLLSLPINISDHLKDLTNISRLIVTFSLLKYYKLVTHYFYVSVSLSMAIHKQFITIEYMIMHHSCTLEYHMLYTSTLSIESFPSIQNWSELWNPIASNIIKFVIGISR